MPGFPPGVAPRRLGAQRVQSRPHRRTARRQALDHLVIVTPGLGGSATLTFTASGSLTAPAYIVGLNLSGENPGLLVTSTLTFTTSGVLTALLSGSSTITFTTSGGLLSRTIVVGEYVWLPETVSPSVPAYLSGNAFLVLSGTLISPGQVQLVGGSTLTFTTIALPFGTDITTEMSIGSVVGAEVYSSSVVDARMTFSSIR